MANTSGPLGNVPRPPIAVVVSSFNSPRSRVLVLPGFEIKENTCSPGRAAGKSPNWNVMLAAAATEVFAFCVNVTRRTVVTPNVLVVTADTEVPAGNCVVVVSTLVPIVAPDEFHVALVKNKKLVLA